VSSQIDRRAEPTLSPAPIDQEVLSPLRDLGLEDFHELIRLFLDEARLRVARARTLEGQGDVAGVAGVMHTLRGSGSAFGATALSTRCAEIEDAITQGTPIDLPAAVTAVELEFARVHEALTEELR
jgi:HPt (histidine-containing phosphotransfer) domain-containing protein